MRPGGYGQHPRTPDPKMCNSFKLDGEQEVEVEIVKQERHGNKAAKVDGILKGVKHKQQTGNDNGWRHRQQCGISKSQFEDAVLGPKGDLNKMKAAKKLDQSAFAFKNHQVYMIDRAKSTTSTIMYEGKRYCTPTLLVVLNYSVSNSGSIE